MEILSSQADGGGGLPTIVVPTGPSNSTSGSSSGGRWTRGPLNECIEVLLYTFSMDKRVVVVK